MVKVAIPTEGEEGLNALVATRFARAPKFTIIELNEKGDVVNIEVIDNTASQASSGAGVKAAQLLINLGVDMVAATSIGPNAKVVLDEMNIKSVIIPAGIKVREALKYIKERLGIS